MARTTNATNKFIVLLYSDQWDEEYHGHSFETLEEAQKYAKKGWRESGDYDIEDIDEEKIFIAEIQSRYVNNPSFVSV